ncbi:3-phosphoglycerate dehydrogenase [Paroceanicella profunda]|uniref:3-phosphoglycerate dehydrogenase n=2 Tax=Paroceanicella profunda TaxID=2579971 RepID=A0A5B8FIW7_9RHOB|nr:3-phosphoglycerate dehydrogenase [Paroceanicella profunda]
MLDPVAPERLARVAALLPEGWEIGTAASRAPRDQLAALTGARFAITGDVPVTAAMMEVPGLAAVHKWGVGYDNIDCDAARAHGVRVLRTTGSNAVAVAETALGMMLALERNIVRGHVALRGGAWAKGALAPTSGTLSGKVVGIVGLGHIGTALARLLRGFGCGLLYTKRRRLPAAEEAALGVRYVPLDTLLAEADVVSLHCALTPDTTGLIGAAALSRMKPGALLVNLARGGVVDEEALADAIEAGALRGAATDVFAVEPMTPGHRLARLDRVIVTPHLGAVSAESFEPTLRRIFVNLAAIARGAAPPEHDVVV